MNGTQRTTAAAIATLLLAAGYNRSVPNDPQGQTAEILVTYRCEVGHTHREVVEAWPNQQGVLMPATEAGNQVECLLPGNESEVEP